MSHVYTYRSIILLSVKFTSCCASSDERGLPLKRMEGRQLPIPSFRLSKLQMQSTWSKQYTGELLLFFEVFNPTWLLVLWLLANDILIHGIISVLQI